MRKLVVFSILALFALTAATPVFAQSLGVEVLGVVKLPCLNGKTILVVRSPAGTIAEFLKESGTLASAPVLKLYHADFVQFVGPEASKESFIAEMSRPRKCVKFGPIPDTNGSENKGPSPADTIGSEH